MPKMKSIQNTLLITVIHIVLCSTILSQRPDPSALRFEFRLEKNIYLVDEPIYYEAVEQNVSDAIISTSPMFPSAHMFFQIVLIDSQGDTLPYKGSIAYIHIDRNRPGILLSPGEKLYDVRNLLGIFGNQDNAHGISYYLPTGTYTIKAIHKTNYHAPLEWSEAVAATKGDAEAAEKMIDRMAIESSEVEFEVIQPQGIEKMVHTKLTHLYRLREPIKGREPVEIIPLLNELIERYPESVYAPAAYERMGFFIDPESRAKTLWDEEVILEKYPNRLFTFPLIKSMGMSSQVQRIESLRSRFPDTKVSEYCSHQLENIRKRESR